MHIFSTKKHVWTQGAGNFGLYSEVVSADSVDFTDYSWMTLQESHGGRPMGRWSVGAVGDGEFVGQVADRR